MTQEYSLKSQYIQFNVTEVINVLCQLAYILASFSYKGPVKFDLNIWIRFLDSMFKNNAISCVEKFQSFLNSKA